MEGDAALIPVSCKLWMFVLKSSSQCAINRALRRVSASWRDATRTAMSSVTCISLLWFKSQSVSFSGKSFRLISTKHVRLCRPNMPQRHISQNPADCLRANGILRLSAACNVAASQLLLLATRRKGRRSTGGGQQGIKQGIGKAQNIQDTFWT